MAQYRRIEVILAMEGSGLVPIFYHKDLDICRNVVEACYQGGARVFEFTNRGDFAHKIFERLIQYAISELPGMIMGVGSVVDAPTASLYIQLGANFIVSPVLNPEMAAVCNRRKIAWSPGCGSLTEISKAEELGAEIVKIFPGSQVGGPGFVSSVKGPCPWTSIMPTGGVSPTEQNLGAWFEAGVACVGMGSKLITKEIIANNEFDLLESKVRGTLEIISSIRARK